jgi:glycosyltransferase involved in cell wall biosynthesis
VEQRDLTFVIPTYRLRDVGETVEQYDQHFWRNGHSVRVVVFDDSSPANQEKYFPLLEQTRTHNDLFYVGPREKEQFLGYLSGRLRDARLDGIVRNLFRPSYGGNRNCALIYTLGDLVVSSDDDMRPFALMEDSPESLHADEISRGRLHKAGTNGFVHKSFDVIAAFEDVLSKRVAEIPENYERGELLIDTAMDLETNATKGVSIENSLMLEHGAVADSAVVKIAQTFRSGSNDIDAIDFVDMFLADEEQVDPDTVNDSYVLVNFRPVVTNRNWRMDCGVAGYDNTFGLPPFFPTRLRFEDYIYRLWVQREGVVAAHVDAAQHHTRSSYMRNPPAAEIFNEEVSNLIKRKINASVTRLDELGVAFDYNGEVTAADAKEVLDKIVGLHTRALAAVPRATTQERSDALRLFAANLNKAFYGFEPDFFQQNLVRIVDDVISAIRGSIELWPTLVEISYFQKGRHGLPQLRVHNHKSRNER